MNQSPYETGDRAILSIRCLEYTGADEVGKHAKVTATVAWMQHNSMSAFAHGQWHCEGSHHCVSTYKAMRNSAHGITQ